MLYLTESELQKRNLKYTDVKLQGGADHPAVSYSCIMIVVRMQQYEGFSRGCLYIKYIKVKNAAKIRNPYNQAPHLTKDTTWESDKTQLSITNKSQEISPFPAGDHKAAMNRHESMTNTSHE